MIIKAILHQVYKTVKRPYYWTRSAWPVWYHLLNWRSPKITSLVGLDSIQQRVASELKTNGCTLTHLDELFPGQNQLPVFQNIARDLMTKADVKTRKSYLKQLFDLNPVVDLNDRFVQLAVSDQVLQIVNAYFGLQARLTYYSLDLVEPVGDAPATMSQRWHRDPEDKLMCTVFLYLTNVGPENGPLHYVKNSQYNGHYGRIFPQKPPRGYYPPAGAVERAVRPEDIAVFTCRAGTLAFFDTAGLHRGGNAKSGQRLAFSARYISRAGYMDDRLRYPENFREQLALLPPLAQYALRR